MEALQALQERIEKINAHLASQRKHLNPDVVDGLHLHKLTEEVGEVSDAYIGLTGFNPRKGVYATMDDLRNELMDVALTALCAYEHFTYWDTSDPDLAVESATGALYLHAFKAADRLGLEVARA